MPATLSDVRSYYDRNTALFLRFGSHPQTQTIHRSLWTEGIRRLSDALAESNNMILSQARSLNSPDLRIVDLGCGVGATLLHVLAGLEKPAMGIGVTLSSIQARLAESARRKLGSQHTSFLQGDFQHVPLDGGFQLIYSIEAFVHAQEPARYLQEAARLLHSKGRLVLLDDFRVSSDAYAQRWLNVYLRGWYIPNIQTAEQVTASARTLGLLLVETRDLTPSLRLRAFPDGIARLLLWLGDILPQNHPIVRSMMGSIALQQCLRAGWIEYRWMVFEKR
jgi:cyclopropane fatty-acyl-phospholipid synthase-like methyltransferase